MRRVVVVFALGVLLSLSSYTSGFECLDLVGRWPYGPASAVAAAGSHVYLGSGGSLLIVEIFGPDGPGVCG